MHSKLFDACSNVQADALRQAREKELTLHEQEYKKVTEEKNTIEKQLQRQKEEAKELQQELEALKVELKREATRVKCAARRIIRNAPAYGWRIEHSLSRELRTMRIGSALEMLTKSGNRRPDLRYLKVGAQLPLGHRP